MHENRGGASPPPRALCWMMSKKEIQESFNKRANTSYVTVVTGTDLTIDKNSTGETVASVEYQVIKPIFGNISILIDFSAAANIFFK